MKEDMFKSLNHLSQNLCKGIDLFIDRLDMTQRDRELFYDIINFTFDEGKIKGQEDFLNQIPNTKKDEQKED
jgi:hypothetical protein